MDKAKKHVIVLGAGASVGSGYPDANRLRVLMSSRDELSAHFAQLGGADTTSLLGCFDHFKTAVHYFRDGGFASVDEFCKLAGRGHLANEVTELKKLMRLVLCLHNPELHFEKSEYYRFIQKLFINDDWKLRDDIVVLSYNYDPYLEYLLSRAYQVRYHVNTGKKDSPPGWNSVNSGMFLLGEKSWMNEKGFALLKLHGSAVYPAFDSRSRLSWVDLFGSKKIGYHVTDRFPRLCSGLSVEPPPIIFPWEMIDKGGNFLEAKDFPLEGSELHSVFSAVWCQAQEAVTQADKISFVGLSMHPYLEDGLRFLFQRKSGQVEIVVANRGNQLPHGSSESDASRDSRCPAGRVREFLRKNCPSLASKTQPHTLLIRCLLSFEEFIWQEMD
jgi:hypothetical protein